MINTMKYTYWYTQLIKLKSERPTDGFHILWLNMMYQIKLVYVRTRFINFLIVFVIHKLLFAKYFGNFK